MGKKEKKGEFHFLLIEDDLIVRQNIADYLKSFGYFHITEVSNGMEALNILHSSAVDFIISDWDMPEATGLDVLQAVKSDPKLKHIPFIMVTSPVSQERMKVVEAASSKVDAYIIKPFRSHVLKQKIDGLLSEMSYRGKSKVIVVDDDLEVLDTVVQYLKTMGYQDLLMARDGEQGFKLIEENISDLAFVVSDWEMPKLAGIDLLKRIRESQNEEMSNLPFIMITSQTSIERIKLRRAIEADVDNYLLKPFRSEDLKARVENALNSAKQTRELQNQMKLAESYYNSGDLDDAEAICRDLIKRVPKFIPSYLLLGLIQMKSGVANRSLDKAIQTVKHALSINSKFDESYIHMAIIYENILSLEKAMSYLREGIFQCPFSEKLHFHLGRLLIRRGLYSAGIEEIRRAIEIKPDYPEALELYASYKNRG